MIRFDAGMFHDGMPRRRVLIRKGEAPISIAARKTTGEIGSIIIDHEKFLGDIEAHLQSGIAFTRARPSRSRQAPDLFEPPYFARTGERKPDQTRSNAHTDRWPSSSRPSV